MTALLGSFVAIFSSDTIFHNLCLIRGLSGEGIKVAGQKCPGTILCQ